MEAKKGRLTTAKGLPCGHSGYVSDRTSSWTSRSDASMSIRIALTVIQSLTFSCNGVNVLHGRARYSPRRKQLITAATGKGQHPVARVFYVWDDVMLPAAQPQRNTVKFHGDKSNTHIVREKIASGLESTQAQSTQQDLPVAQSLASHATHVSSRTQHHPHKANRPDTEKYTMHLIAPEKISASLSALNSAAQNLKNICPTKLLPPPRNVNKLKQTKSQSHIGFRSPQKLQKRNSPIYSS